MSTTKPKSAEEKCAELNPNLISSRCTIGRVKGMQETRWIVKEIGSTMPIGEGNTEAAAWKDALGYLVQKNSSNNI